MLNPGGAEGRQNMPVGQGVDEMVHFGVGLANPFTKIAQHRLLDDGLVKVGPGDADPAGGEDFTFAAITEPHDGNIESAAAKVEDQNILRSLQGSFVI